MGHLVVDVPPREGPVEVGEGVVDPLLYFLHQLTAGVAIQPVGHLGAWIQRYNQPLVFLMLIHGNLCKCLCVHL